MTKTVFHKLAGTELGLVFMIEDDVRSHEADGWEVRAISALPHDVVAVVYWRPGEDIYTHV